MTAPTTATTFMPSIPSTASAPVPNRPEIGLGHHQHEGAQAITTGAVRPGPSPATRPTTLVDQWYSPATPATTAEIEGELGLGRLPLGAAELEPALERRGRPHEGGQQEQEQGEDATDHRAGEPGAGPP